MKESHPEYMKILDNSPDGIVIADVKTKEFVYVNPTICRILGYEESELKELSFYGLHPKEVTDEVEKNFTRQSVGTETGIIAKNIPCKNKDGKITYFDVNTVPIEFNGKKCNLGFFRNKTHENKYKKELEASQKLLSKASEIAKIGGWEIDVKTRHLSWTEGTYLIHEVPLGETPDIEDAIKFFIPEHRARLEKAINRALEQGAPYDLILRLITAKGRKLWTHTVCEPLVVDGKTVKLYGFFSGYNRAEET